ncbi:glycoside hydrolase family 9 protein [Coleofasciculus sp. LEGE 07092]|nr:glycoside hydrolase family 9 protein [Coleofasciculus sp. LEGE 07081]MBE9148514.1 glycoside hydrolase family 9 protein [Coleofasciculus sp. LEGE 07092]
MRMGRRFFLGWTISIASGLLGKGQAQTVERETRAKLLINQVGYSPTSPKSAFLINFSNPETRQVELVNAKNKRTVFVANLGEACNDEASQNVIQIIDFTPFNREGRYYLKYGTVESYPFQIGNNIYQDSFVKMLRSYYLQRCGVVVRDSVNGIGHSPCHLNDGAIAHTDEVNRAGEVKFARGGWHDAGDFGKYVGPTAVTVGRLLSLYEHYPNLFSDRQLTIPESGNGRPDLLDEMKIGLDWMLAMQRRDGAVYRKLSGKEWPGMILPNEDIQPRLIYGISTPETAKFAAAMAMAARIYTPHDVLLAKNYLKAAQKSWDFLQSEPAMRVDWVEGDDSGSGKYLAGEWDTDEALTTDKDDRLWAAAELFITTGDARFEDYLKQQIPSFFYTLFEWKDPSSLGMIDYLMQTNGKGSDSLNQQIKEKLLERADTLLPKVAGSGYRLANDKFIWASNKLTAEEGITLLYAYRITGNPEYFNAAVDQLDYLLGRNPFNLSFVTGVGSNSVQNVHHRVAQAKKIVIPGLMVGGPNTEAQDGIAPKGLGLLSYIDDAQSYATNEYAIDYNASAIALMGMVMAEVG